MFCSTLERDVRASMTQNQSNYSAFILICVIVYCVYIRLSISVCLPCKCSCIRGYPCRAPQCLITGRNGFNEFHFYSILLLHDVCWNIPPKAFFSTNHNEFMYCSTVRPLIIAVSACQDLRSRWAVFICVRCVYLISCRMFTESISKCNTTSEAVSHACDMKTRIKQ
jgi:hypothetical protein